MRFLMTFLFAACLLLGADDAFTGKWASSQNDSSGEFRLKLKPEPEVTFTLQGADVKTKIVKSKIDGDNVEIDYDFELEGYRLRSSMKGTLSGDKLDAKYETTTVDDGNHVDSGTMTGTRVK